MTEPAVHILFVGREEGLVDKFRQHAGDVEVSVICRKEHVSRIRRAESCDRILGLPTASPVAEWVECAEVINRMSPITRIGHFGEHDADKAAAIAEQLGLAFHPISTVECIRRKSVMRQRLRDLGVDDTPATTVVSASELRSFTDAVGFPVAVKPEAGTASVGIGVAWKSEDLVRCFDRASTAKDQPLRGVLVERFHIGHQFSVEAFSEHGEHLIVAITRKYSDPATLVELGHVMPAPLADPERESISDFTLRLLRALDVQFGPTHTELVLTESGPRLIETHLRVGDMYELVPAATGIDLVELQVRQQLGHDVMDDLRAAMRQKWPERYAAVWYAYTDLVGTLVKIVGLEAVPEAMTVRQLIPNGAQVHGLESNYSRVAEVQLVRDDAAAALTDARTAVSRMRIVVHHPPTETEVF